MRMCMPDAACVGIDVPTTRHRQGRHYQGQVVEVDDPVHARALRAEGAFPASLTGTHRHGGYRCPECGFGSFFARCGRCGATCEKET